MFRRAEPASDHGAAVARALIAADTPSDTVADSFTDDAGSNAITDDAFTDDAVSDAIADAGSNAVTELAWIHIQLPARVLQTPPGILQRHRRREMRTMQRWRLVLP